MINLKHILPLLCLLICSQTISAQDATCYETGSFLIFSTLSTSDCPGLLSYDYEGPANSCEDCPSSVEFTVSGEGTITVYSDGIVCDVIDIQIVDEPTITLTSNSEINCNEFQFSGESVENISEWSWDFESDVSPDADTQSGVYQFSSSGNQLITLNATTAEGCQTITTTSQFVEGPWAELSATGMVNGGTGNLTVSDFNDQECVISYCVLDLETDHTIYMYDVFHNNNSAVNISYVATFNGVEIHNAATPIPSDGIEIDMSAQGNPGYNDLVYTITDSEGCTFVKEYEVYWETFTILGAGIDNTTPGTIINYCYDQELEFELTASETAGLTYFFFIGCQNSSFEELQNQAVYSEVPVMAPNETVTVSWTADATSCGCTGNSLSAYLFTSNPCTTFQVGSESFQVSEDPSAEFDYPEITCLNSTETLEWLGPSDLPFGGTCGGFITWSVEAPDGTFVANAGSDPTLNYTFDQVGTYEVCLGLSTGIGCSASSQCYEICVQNSLSSGNVEVIWPDETGVCVIEEYLPEITLPELECETVSVNWNVSLEDGNSAAGLYTLSSNGTETPTIEFLEKGVYQVRAQVFSECGSPLFTELVNVGAAPIVTVNQPSIASCPEETVCFDEAFCIDDCGSVLSQASLTVYEGVITDCNAPITNTQVWTADANPLIILPDDMQGEECNASNSPCEFSWSVPEGVTGEFTLVLEVTNPCGNEVVCIPLNIITPGELEVPIADEVCAGFTIDPETTTLNQCEWLVDGVTVWSPGNTGVITIDEDATVTINCNQGDCPETTTKDISVFPAINPVITGSTEICPDGTVILTASSDSGEAQQWYEGSCAQVSELTATLLASEVNAEFSASAAGTYAVVVSDMNGCEACVEHLITLEVPPVSSCGNLVFCETDTEEPIGLECITAPVGSTLSWSISDDDDNVVVSNPSLDYTLGDLLNEFGPLDANHTFLASYEVFTANSCTYTGSYSITVNQLGVSEVSVEEYCEANALELIGGEDSNWETGNLPAGTFSIADGNLELLSTLENGTYTGINYDSGCSQQPYDVTVFALPEVALTGPDFLCDLFDENISLNTSSGAAPPVSFQWRNSACGEAVVNIPGATNPFFSLDEPGHYSVQLTDGNGCSSCAGIEIVLDEKPVSNCQNVSFCENLGDSELDLSCIELPDGENTAQWSITHPTNANFPVNVSAPFTVDDLIQELDPLNQEVITDEAFMFYHQWISDNDCVYLDSVEVIILDEAVSLDQMDVCSGDELELNQALLGTWQWTATPASSANVTDSDVFTWIPLLADAGAIYTLRFTSNSGCGATDYEIQAHATPEVSISTPEVNMCILTSQAISVDAGIATDLSVNYEYETGSEAIDLADLVFDPTALGITDTDPGQLHLEGSLTYTTLLGADLICSAEDIQVIDIVDTLESLAVPNFICQGAEFNIDLCSNPSLDAFTFSLGGNDFNLADCPFAIPALFGTQSYALEAMYGSDFALQCQVQSSGEITIQEQLTYTYTSESFPCTGEQEITIEVLTGNTSSITLLADDVLLNTPLEAEEVFTEVLSFSPADAGLDEVFDFELEITDGVCTTEVVSDEAQYIATPDLAISIDELNSEFDGCGSDLLIMEMAVPNTSFVDQTTWTMNADYFPETVLLDEEGMSLPEAVDLLNPPLESAVVAISAMVSNQCGTDTDTVFHIMNPSDVQLQIEELTESLCAGEEIEISSIINLEEYTLEAVVTPAADMDWNPLTETLTIGDGVPEGTYNVEFTAIGTCGQDVAFDEFYVYEFVSAEFDYIGFTCVDEPINFAPLNGEELSGFEWDFGNSSTAQSPNPIQSYSENGIYEVSLTAFYSEANCQVTSTEQIEIGGAELSISPGDFGYCGSSEAAYDIDIENPQTVEWTILNPYTDETITYFTESTPLLEFDFDEDSEEVVEYVISAYVIDAAGCPSEDEVTASVYPAPKADISFNILNPSDDIAAVQSGDLLQVFLGVPCREVEIEFFNNHDVNNCFWTNNLGEMCDASFDNCSKLTYCTENEGAGQLSIDVDNEFQCTASDVLDVVFICEDKVTLYVPNSFTPNQDGNNDVFEYEFRGVVSNFELFIFDRWGEAIFHTTELGDYWDGSDERGDHYVPNGVYSWQILVDQDTDDAQRLTGHVSIFR
ncbi:MAG: gliding motility-associated C-terminal domain-containing protein [Flavobacteriales bacterium]